PFERGCSRDINPFRIVHSGITEFLLQMQQRGFAAESAKEENIRRGGGQLPNQSLPFGRGFHIDRLTGLPTVLPSIIPQGSNAEGDSLHRRRFVRLPVATRKRKQEQNQKYG